MKLLNIMKWVVFLGCVTYIVIFCLTKTWDDIVSITINKTHIDKLGEHVSVIRSELTRKFVKNNQTKMDNFTLKDTSVNDTIHTNACDSCFEHNFTDDICGSKHGETIDIVIFIFTTHDKNEARSALRSTWLTYSKNNTANVRYAFLLGETKDKNLSELVLEENKQFQDIIKEDFLDTYMNLTFKTIMGFRWAVSQCAHARYVMKTDDDMFVNIPNLLKMLEKQSRVVLQSSILGQCNKGVPPIRDKNSKWYASEKSYPEKLYPGFCSGTGYVTSMHVARAIYNISPTIPFFHLEDVYIGLCIRKLGFKPVKISGFHHDKQKMDPCIYHGSALITSHQLTPKMLISIWKKPCQK